MFLFLPLSCRQRKSSAVDIQCPRVRNVTEMETKYIANPSKTATIKKVKEDPCAYEDPIPKTSKKSKTKPRSEDVILDSEPPLYEAVEVTFSYTSFVHSFIDDDCFKFISGYAAKYYYVC